MLPNETAAQITIGDTSYRDWFSVDLDSDIFTTADSFHFSAAVPAYTDRDRFREGVKCKIHLGEDLQMTGVIDDVEFGGDRTQSRINVSGRDLAAYLVDNEAKHVKASKYTITTLINSLLDPSFGIPKIVDSNEENRKLQLGKKDKKKPKANAPTFLKPAPRTTVTIDPGQRISTIIDTHTRRLDLAWWMTAKGELFLGKPNYKQDVAYQFLIAPLGTKESQDNNIESWSVRRSISERYSEITVGGTGFSDQGQLWNPSKGAPKYKGVSKDPDLQDRNIVRKMLMVDGDVLSNKEAQARADREQQQRRMQSLVINVTVPGFQQDNRFYAIDTMALVKIADAGIDDLFYVTQRRFTETRGQQRTSLTLHQPNIWLPS